VEKNMSKNIVPIKHTHPYDKEKNDNRVAIDPGAFLCFPG
jgi:hypothetical protein